MKIYEPLSPDNPLLDRERRRLGKRWTYKLFVINVFLFSSVILAVPVAGPRVYRFCASAPARAMSQMSYSLRSQYNAATATTVSVVLMNGAPVAGFGATTYTVRQIPSASPPALLVGLYGQDAGSMDAIQVFYYLESNGADKNGRPLYRTLAAELAWEGDRQWQYLDNSLPTARMKKLTDLVEDETSQALALAPAVWKTGAAGSGGTAGGIVPPPPPPSLALSDPFNYQPVMVAPVRISGNPKRPAEHISNVMYMAMNTAFVVSNGAQQPMGMNALANLGTDEMMGMVLGYIVSYVGGFLLWLYYLISFPARRTGELESRLIAYTLPQLRTTSLTSRDIAAGLLHAPRRYWLWPLCAFVPAMLMAHVVIWISWGAPLGMFLQGQTASAPMTIAHMAHTALGMLVWPLAGWLSFALAARFCGSSLARYASIVIFAFGLPVLMMIVAFAANALIFYLMGAVSGASYSGGGMTVTFVIFPFIQTLFWLAALGVATWLLSRGLGKRIAAFEPRGE